MVVQKLKKSVKRMNDSKKILERLIETKTKKQYKL